MAIGRICRPLIDTIVFANSQYQFALTQYSIYEHKRHSRFELISMLFTSHSQRCPISALSFVCCCCCFFFSYEWSITHTIYCFCGSFCYWCRRFINKTISTAQNIALASILLGVRRNSKSIEDTEHTVEIECDDEMKSRWIIQTYSWLFMRPVAKKVSTFRTWSKRNESKN